MARLKAFSIFLLTVLILAAMASSRGVSRAFDIVWMGLLWLLPRGLVRWILDERHPERRPASSRLR